MPRIKESNQPAALSWPRLIKGTLIKRYNRFIADIKLANGAVAQAHCPNSGSMKACNEPGRPVYLSRADNPKRKLKYTWEMIDMPTSLVGVNTNIPNRLVEASVAVGAIPELGGYDWVRREVRYGRNSRIDLLLESSDRPKAYVEVKNCTLTEDRVAYFPDAVTQRGLKHIHELAEQIKQGNRAVVIFLVQRMDAQRFEPADHIDPEFGKGLRMAVDSGLEALSYDVDINLGYIAIRKRLPVILGKGS
jgi:sugar fermentation stimulation protein A